MATRSRPKDRAPFVSLQYLLESAFNALCCYDISDVLAHLCRIRLISEPEKEVMEQENDKLEALRSFLLKDTRRIDTFMNAVKNYADDVHACMMSAHKVYQDYRNSEEALRRQEMIKQARYTQTAMQRRTTQEDRFFAEEQHVKNEPRQRDLSQDDSIVVREDQHAQSKELTFEDHGYLTMTTLAQDNFENQTVESTASHSTHSSQSTLDFERLFAQTGTLQQQSRPYHNHHLENLKHTAVVPCNVFINNYYYPTSGPLSSAQYMQCSAHEKSLPIQRTDNTTQHSTYNDPNTLQRDRSHSVAVMKNDLLKTYHEQLYDYLDPETLTPYLQAQNLLTTEEVAIICNNIARSLRRQCIRHILSTIPTKGPDAFDKFLSCLASEKTHTGHKVLAELLQKAVET